MIATTNATAQTTAKYLLSEVICRHGWPDYLLSDNASNYAGSVMNIVCKYLGISQRFASPHHPQSNPTERMNREIKRQIRIFCQSNKNWDELLPLHAASLRFNVCASTGETPFRVMHGRDPNLPLDVIFKPDGKPMVDASAEIVRSKARQIALGVEKLNEQIRATNLEQLHECAINTTKGGETRVLKKVIWYGFVSMRSPAK